MRPALDRVRHMSTDHRRPPRDRAALTTVLVGLDLSVGLVRRYLASGQEPAPEPIAAVDIDASVFLREVDE